MNDVVLTEPPLREASKHFGARMARRMFGGRKGHGGAPVSYLQLRQDSLANALAVAYDTGLTNAGAKPLALPQSAAKVVDAWNAMGLGKQYDGELRELEDAIRAMERELKAARAAAGKG